MWQAIDWTKDDQTYEPANVHITQGGWVSNNYLTLFCAIDFLSWNSICV